jgi:PD-(D/E)XK endonuclease
MTSSLTSSQRFCAVQARAAHRGVRAVRTVTSRFTPNGYVRRPYSAAEIDAIAAYAPELRESFLIPMTRMSGYREMISLRLEPTRNNQTEGVRWARDYELASVIERLRAQPSSPGRLNFQNQVTGL